MYYPDFFLCVDVVSDVFAVVGPNFHMLYLVRFSRWSVGYLFFLIYHQYQESCKRYRREFCILYMQKPTPGRYIFLEHKKLSSWAFKLEVVRSSKKKNLHMIVSSTWLSKELVMAAGQNEGRNYSVDLSGFVWYAKSRTWWANPEAIWLIAGSLLLAGISGIKAPGVVEHGIIQETKDLMDPRICRETHIPWASQWFHLWMCEPEALFSILLH